MARNLARDGNDTVGDVGMIPNNISQIYSDSICEDAELQASRDLSTMSCGSFSAGSLIVILNSPTLTFEQIASNNIWSVRFDIAGGEDVPVGRNFRFFLVLASLKDMLRDEDWNDQEVDFSIVMDQDSALSILV